MNAFTAITTLIPVDQGVPIPDSRFQWFGGTRYPFKQMEVGDSFFVPGKTIQDLKGPLNYASCDCRRFTTRRVTENGITGLRIWRIA